MSPLTSTAGSVTAADLAHLVNPHSASGYSNVYAHRKTHDGVWLYRVAIGNPIPQYTPDGRNLPRRTNLGQSYRSPRDAAAAFVVYLRGKYGDRWAAVWKARKKNPWRVRYVRPGQFRAEVYLCGRLVGLTRGDVDPTCPPARRGDYLLPSRAACRAAIRAYAVKVCDAHGTRNPRDVFWRAS